MMSQKNKERSYFEKAQELFDYTRELRRDFHQHPELGFQEYRTAEVIVQELKKLPGIKIQTGLGGTGVVGLMEGKNQDKVILLRFDMDALPISEETGAEYASTHPGLMHACGHDGHMAIGLTTARMLSQGQEQLAGTIKFVFQPAEEGLGGAKKIIEDGVLENPRPDINLALHLWNEKPLGWMAISDGPIMAASDRFDLTLIGRGGHGAKPHDAVDPIMAAAEIISAMQTIISRELNPLERGVITISTVHAGTAHNIIPNQVQISGTIRSFTPSVRELMINRLEELVKNLAAGFRCQVDIRFTEISPAVVNDAEIAGKIRVITKQLFPEMRIEGNYQTLVSEDMALLMKDIPSCYCLIGSANQEKGLGAHHHQPSFNFDERAMIYGVSLLATAVTKLLQT